MWKIRAILFNKAQIMELRQISEDSKPFEGCAILLGILKKDIVDITDILPANNQAKSSITFEIDPQNIYEAYQQADREGKEVVAIFHSHPADPEPSFLDIKFMSINPIVWIIISTTSLSFRAYQYTENKVKDVKIIISNDD